MRVEIQMRGKTETSAQWGRQHALTCGGTDHGETWKRQRNRRCARPFAHHHIHTEILHGDIQQFLRSPRQTVDLINEQYFAGFQRAENGRQVSGMLNGRSGGDTNRNLKLVSHNHG